MITLSVTPIRRISGFNKIIKLRRMLGLFAFYYVFLHFSVYLGLDRLLDWNEIVEDIAKRPYITVGFSAFLMLIPLALTSTKGWIRRLGKRWQKLHRLIYVVAVFGVIHFWWLVKKDITDPLIFAVILTILFAIRIFYNLKKRNKIFRHSHQSTDGHLALKGDNREV
jgi:sulfoxide reductase heme-binding subunit YedZ